MANTTDNKEKRLAAFEAEESFMPDLTEEFLDGHLLAEMAQGGAATLHSNADEVNRLNVFPVPDGDTGDNMRMTIESGIAALESIESNDLAEVMTALSHGMLLGARGNSGVILSQFFAGVAKGFEGSERANPTTVANALEMGVKQAYSSVMTPTEGTILTVAREAVAYAKDRVSEESTLRTLFADLVKEMHGSLQRTQNILPALKEAGVVDSGGAGLLYIVEGFYRVLCGEKVEALPEGDAPKAKAVAFDSFGPDSVMEYGYCTEFLLQLQNAKTDIEHFDVDAIKNFLVEAGNSVVCFQTGSIVKVHVHTMTPEKVLGFCREFGEFLTVKIENMSVQHSENPDAPAKGEEKKPKGEKKKYALVAAVNGAGLAELFRSMGVDAIVEGGQTSNPSTQDFLSAFEDIRAENIILLPNNSNIIMAANQAASIYTEAKVFVLPSKNVGRGYVALSAFDPTEEPEAILAAMEEAMGAVSAGFVSPAIRDAQMNGVDIHNGDFIGFIDKEILFSAESRFLVAESLALRMMKEEGRFLFTVFTGKDAPGEETAALEEALREQLPDAEIYFMEGGQDIYPYIFVAE